MAKDIGMTIRKGIAVSFLPCLVAFWGFHPYMFFHFCKCFFVTCFCCFLGGGHSTNQDYNFVRIVSRLLLEWLLQYL